MPQAKGFGFATGVGGEIQAEEGTERLKSAGYYSAGVQCCISKCTVSLSFSWCLNSRKLQPSLHIEMSLKSATTSTWSAPTYQPMSASLSILYGSLHVLALGAGSISLTELFLPTLPSLVASQSLFLLNTKVCCVSLPSSMQHTYNLPLTHVRGIPLGDKVFAYA